MTQKPASEMAPARAGAVSRPCAQCGKPVHRRVSALPASGRVFCDAACNLAYRRAKAAAREGGVGSVVKDCAVCGKTFRSSPSQKRICCSLACRDVHMVGQKRTYKKRATTAEMVTKECAFCGKPVTRRATDSRPRHFCDRSCAAKQLKREGRIGRGAKVKVGDITTTAAGYVRVFIGKDHPMADPKGYCLQHRLVMSEILGRPLLPNENVHHINGVRNDNRPENLESWVMTQPKGQRPLDLVAWAREILATYEPIEDRLAD